MSDLVNKPKLFQINYVDNHTLKWSVALYINIWSEKEQERSAFVCLFCIFPTPTRLNIHEAQDFKKFIVQPVDNDQFQLSFKKLNIY